MIASAAMRVSEVTLGFDKGSGFTVRLPVLWGGLRELNFFPVEQSQDEVGVVQYAIKRTNEQRQISNVCFLISWDGGTAGSPSGEWGCVVSWT